MDDLIQPYARKKYNPRFKAVMWNISDSDRKRSNPKQVKNPKNHRTDYMIAGIVSHTIPRIKNNKMLVCPVCHKRLSRCIYGRIATAYDKVPGTGTERKYLRVYMPYHRRTRIHQYSKFSVFGSSSGFLWATAPPRPYAPTRRHFSIFDAGPHHCTTLLKNSTRCSQGCLNSQSRLESVY